MSRSVARAAKRPHQPDHVPPPDAGAEISYGVDVSGRLVHVSEVSRGLACGLRCPGCSELLVARKGEFKVAHLAHYAMSATCVERWETTLHRLAKQILASSTEVRLPEVVARWGDRAEPVAPAVTLRYRDVRTEEWLGGLRPDIIVSTGSRELLVEVLVTHACDEVKIAKLRKRDLAAIEIDLSGVNRFDSPAEHARQVLETAPRTWLHNAKMAVVETRLKAEADALAADGLRKLRWQHDRTAKEIAACWNDTQRPEQAVWLQRAEDARLTRYAGFDIPGDKCFAVGPRTWQAAILHLLVTRGRWQTHSVEGILKHLQAQKLLRPPFELRRKWPTDLVACVREQITDFVTPSEVLSGYATIVASFGILRQPGPGRWQAVDAVSESAARTYQENERVATRRREISGTLSAIEAEIGSGGPTFVERWWRQPCQHLGGVPHDLATAHSWEWRSTVGKIEAVANMLRSGGPVLSEDAMLGFPFGRQRDERLVEEAKRATKREEEWRESRRRRARDFIAEFTGKARGYLGEHGGSEWANAALGEMSGDFADDDRFDYGSAWRTKLGASLSAEADRRDRERREASRREALRQESDRLAAKVRAELEREVRTAFSDPAMGDLWLRSTQPGFCASPWNYCTDERRLSTCVSLLKAAKGKRGR